MDVVLISPVPPKPADVLDRTREWQTLASVLASPKPELVFVTGRRRVGKSYLLGRFATAAGGLYYQATRRTEGEQLSRLSRALGDRFDDAALKQGAALPDWEALLEYIARRTGTEPFFLVLDEFPYLADAAPALTSILQLWWDHRWQTSRIKLVLSGSHITAMTRLAAADQPLFGRRTRRIAFAPFGPGDVSEFVPIYNATETLVAYGAVGGLPGHLSLLDPAADLVDNLSSLLLDSGGRLADEAQHMLDAFLGDAAVHYSILEAIATGDQTWRGITNRIGRSGGAALRPLEWLADMQIIERIVPIDETVPSKSKRTIYRVTDHYVAFWHRFIAPMQAIGAIGLVNPDRLWSNSIAPHLSNYMGPVFEDACRQAVRTGRVKLPFTPVRVGEWWNSASSEQLDIVALGDDGEVFCAECKWGGVSSGDVDVLRRRAHMVSADLGRNGPIHLAVFSGSGSFDAALTRDITHKRIQAYSAMDIV